MASHTPKDAPRWHAAIAVLFALGLYMRLPQKLTLGPIWVAPVLVAVLLLPLLFGRSNLPERVRRFTSVGLIGVLNFFNIASVVLLIDDILNSHAVHHNVAALDLLKSGGMIWLVNVIVFSLWYWEIDDGGVVHRNNEGEAVVYSEPDFLFPQMGMHRDLHDCEEDKWSPEYLDYVYIAFTNALAFSPADVMPLTRIAKMMMMVEALVSFVTIGVIIARSVGILN
jgi:uncharacterized membrane protein